MYGISGGMVPLQVDKIRIGLYESMIDSYGAR